MRESKLYFCGIRHWIAMFMPQLRIPDVCLLSLRPGLRLAWAVILCSISMCRLYAQTASSDAAQVSDYTIHANSKVVLTDVSVADKDGKPVTGLKASDFQIFDNGRPQQLSSFEEHGITGNSQPAAPQAAKRPGVYSNDFMRNLPPVLNIVLIDVRGTGFPVLGFTWYEVNRFIRQLPANEPVAIYVRASDVVMLQSFTSDHGLLLAAVRKAVNRFALPSGSSPSDVVTLHAIANDIGQLPGRKHVLWFTGTPEVAFTEDGSLFEDDADLRQVYDELQSARVAVYPIDVDGVLPYTGFDMTKREIKADGSVRAGNHYRMDEIAQSTGGHAFYNNNALDRIAANIVKTDGAYYTLTYSPAGPQFDGKWHRVEVKVAAKKPALQLSYRHGYFADDIQDRSGAGKYGRVPGRTLLEGSGVKLADRPDAWSAPIILNVTVLPVAAMTSDPLPVNDVLPSPAQKKSRRSVPYVVRYTIPASEVTVTTASGVAHAEIGVSVVAVDHYGNIVAHEAEHVTLARSDKDVSSDPNKPIEVEQRALFPNGDVDLFCAVWDMSSHRLGSIEVPLKVTKERPAGH